MTNTLTFVSYNVQGLYSKLDNGDFMQYIKSFDFICLTETFVDHTFEHNCFPDHYIYESKAKRYSNYGRSQGGVLVLVKKMWLKHVMEIKLATENMIALILDSDLMNIDKKTVFLSCYLPPQESKFWKNNGDTTGPECLEEAMMEIGNQITDFYLIVCGDLNARTADKSYKTLNLDGIEHDLEQESDDFKRTSMDNKTNLFGEQLLEFCQMTDCTIINGLQKFGSFGNEFTFVSKQGTSVIDYFLASTELILQQKFESLTVKERLESDHMPIELIMRTDQQNGNKMPNYYRKPGTNQRKFIWQDCKKSIFIDNLLCEESVKEVSTAIDMINIDVDQALEKFTNCILHASECMKKAGRHKEMPRNKWFDNECLLAKKNTLCKLKIFRKQRTVENRMDYIQAKKSYRKLTKAKKNDFNIRQANSLDSKIRDSQQFWKDLKSLWNNKTHVNPETFIPIENWYQHFENLFRSASGICENPADGNIDENMNFDLNGPITEQEVLNAIDNLRNRKSSGPDNICSEMLKAAGKRATQFLTNFFNEIFNKGYYPREWGKSIIVPIFKKGDITSPDNYRGISLSSIISKCYTSILNKRIYNWLEENDKISETQAGFRRDHSTIDHIYTLTAIIQEQLSKKGRKLYVAFVDFRKAFDLISHRKLLATIAKDGINGKMYCTIKSMYESLEACVRVGDQLSEYFPCMQGVRQGCNLSPTLFTIFINNLATYIIENGKHGFTKLHGMMELFILLFADDLTLMSTTPVGLQNQLSYLEDACDSVNLQVNIEKTKILVFRNGGPLSTGEKWFYKGSSIDIVNNFNYLGYNFSTKLSVKKGTDTLVKKGKKAVFGLNSALANLPEMTKQTFFKIFDAKVQPILLYAAEVWGCTRMDLIERVHLLACKRFLGVPKATPTNLVYGELNRFPLYIGAQLKAIRYWLRLTSMDNNRIPRMAYLMLLDMDNRGKTCWASQIKDILSNCGFYFVWIQQGVNNKKQFLVDLRQRLIDIHLQIWSNSIQSKERYRQYCILKPFPCDEQYFTCFTIRIFRIAYTRLRLGVLPINNNSYRFDDNVQKKYCKFCINLIEDENHFIQQCPLYKKLRAIFLCGFETANIYDLMMCTQRENCVRIGKYIHYALKERDKYV